MTSPGSVRSRIQTLLNAPNPGVGRQDAMLACLDVAARALDDAGIARPASAGTGRYMDFANVQAAAAAADAVGEPGSYLGRHDGFVYTPAQMLTTLNRYLLALGAVATSTQPPAAGPGDAAPLYAPAVWRAALDQNGLAGTHVTLAGTEARDPVKLPLGNVVDLAAFRVPGGRAGKAFVANVPAGASRIETQANLTINPSPAKPAYYGFSFLLSRGFPIEENYFHTIARLRAADNAQPVGLTIWQNKLRICGRVASGFFHTWQQVVGDVETGRWHDVVMTIYPTTSASTSWVSVMLDGEETVSGLYPGFAMYPASGAATLRYGLYRDNRCPREACVHHMAWAVGQNPGAVVMPGSG